MPERIGAYGFLIGVNYFENIVENMEAMVKTVVRSLNWSISDLKGLYLDGIDFFGLEYWYNDCVEVHKSINQDDK